MQNTEEMKPVEMMGKRTKVICGKVPTELYIKAKELIDGKRFMTMNDLVEAAVWHFVNGQKNREEGGRGLGN